MTLYLPIGPPASGKTYVMNRAIEALVIDREAVVSTDELRRKLTGDLYDQSANVAVFDIAEKMIYERLKRGLDVWYDATNLLAAWRGTAVHFAELFHAPIVSIRMTANDDLCRTRNWSRKPPIPDGVMEQMIKYRQAIHVEKLPGKVVTDKEFLRTTCSYGGPCDEHC